MAMIANLEQQKRQVEEKYNLNYHKGHNSE